MNTSPLAEASDKSTIKNKSKLESTNTATESNEKMESAGASTLVIDDEKFGILLGRLNNIDLNTAATNSRLDKMDASIQGISNRFNELEEVVIGQEGLREQIKALQFELEQQKTQYAKERARDKEKLAALSDKAENQDNMSRRNNLIIVGIKEEKDESWELTRTLVKDFISTTLSIQEVAIERAHRLGGKKEGTKDRPIILKLLSYPDKMKILAARYKLKDKKIYVNEDYSEMIRKARSCLLNYVKSNNPNKDKFRLIFDKLYFKGKIYRYLEEKGITEI